MKPRAFESAPVRGGELYLWPDFSDARERIKKPHDLGVVQINLD